MRALYIVIILLMGSLMPGLQAVEQEQNKSWWEIRNNTKEHYFSHKAHMDVMLKSGDPCMSCHPFGKNREKDPKKLRELTDILNEPKEAICHSCHVDERTAPAECTLCHVDMTNIRPPDHGHDYLQYHTHDANTNAENCSTCHVNPSFCTDCHFKRNRLGRQYHHSWYIGNHGIDARIGSGNCGKCHNGRFCADCHREVQ